MKITDWEVQSRKKILNLGTDDFLPDGNSIIWGMALLFVAGRRTTPPLELSESDPVLKLHNNKALVRLIEDHLVDLVVWGQNAPTDRCDIFEELAPQLVKPLRLNYVLREFSFQGDLSLNRCTGMYADIDTVTKKWQDSNIVIG